MDKKMYSTTKGILLNTPKPLETRTYKPVLHEELIQLVHAGIDKAGMVLGEELYSCSKEGLQANARYSIKNVADSEMSLMIGWQNSYDKSLTLKFAIGTHIFICSNGSVVGDMGTFKKKHIGEIQEFAPRHILEYIKEAQDDFVKMQKERELLKEIEVTKRTSAELIGRMFLEDNIITSTQLNIIKREIDHPSFDYKSDGSGWQLYNHVTHSLKEAHPALWMKQHMDVHDFFSKNLLKLENA
jgi:hypothetical protein